MMSIVSARYDIARFGMEAFRSSPRQADLLIVSGRVSNKMAAPLRQIYDQMLEPKWVIAMGACASSGGMFNNYAIVQSVDKIVPVAVYVPGCPPRPDQLLAEHLAGGFRRGPPRTVERPPDAWTKSGVKRVRGARWRTSVIDPGRLIKDVPHPGGGAPLGRRDRRLLGWGRQASRLSGRQAAATSTCRGPRGSDSAGVETGGSRSARLTIVRTPRRVRVRPGSTTASRCRL